MIRKEVWGTLDGTDVYLFHLSNRKGDIVSISDYGGLITSWKTKDNDGKISDIIIGFSSLEKYLPNHPNFGALIGRYANRIAHGRFTIDGTTYQLGLNEGSNHLHGGKDNFTKAIWSAETNDDFNTLVLQLESKAGNEGYPGNVKVRVSFHFSEDHELHIHYEAVTDEPTHINLTSHPYFNLSGDFAKGILDHELFLKAEAYTPIDSAGIPTGEIRKVKGTPFDFSKEKPVGIDIVSAQGYDHNFVLHNPDGNVILAAVLSDPSSGRKLEVYTDQPGLQVYTSNALDGTDITDDGIVLRPHAAICLETQHFPDSPNHPHFPSTLLRPGEVFQSHTRYKVVRI